MTNKVTLAQLKEGDTATVSALGGGDGFQQRLRSLGITEGKTLRLVARHPFAGPLVVETAGRQLTIGRGMSMKVTVART